MPALSTPVRAALVLAVVIGGAGVLTVVGRALRPPAPVNPDAGSWRP